MCPWSIRNTRQCAEPEKRSTLIHAVVTLNRVLESQWAAAGLAKATMPASLVVTDQDSRHDNDRTNSARHYACDAISVQRGILFDSETRKRRTAIPVGM